MSDFATEEILCRTIDGINLLARHYRPQAAARTHM